MPFDWEMLENVKKIVVASFLVSIGFIGAIKTYHLKEAQYHEGPLFLRPHSGQTIHHILRYQMKDMFIIFLIIPHSLILTEWFGHSALPKYDGFRYFPANGKNFQARKIIFLDIFFQTTVIR